MLSHKENGRSKQPVYREKGIAISGPGEGVKTKVEVSLSLFFEEGWVVVARFLRGLEIKKVGGRVDTMIEINAFPPLKIST